MKRVTPSSKLSAIWKLMLHLAGEPGRGAPVGTPSGSRYLGSDVVDVDDLTHVVVLQHHLLGLDQRLLAAQVEGVETAAEVAVGCLVAKAQGVPVEANLAAALALRDDFDVADVVRG